MRKHIAGGYIRYRQASRILNKIGQMSLQNKSWSLLSKRGLWRVLILIWIICSLHTPAQALDIISILDNQNVSLFWLATCLASLIFACFALFLMMVQHKHYTHETKKLTNALTQTNREIEYAEKLLNGQGQITIIFTNPQKFLDDHENSYFESVKIFGANIANFITDKADSITNPYHILDFARWLDISYAQQIEQALQNLVTSGEIFQINVYNFNGEMITLSGDRLGYTPVLGIKKLLDKNLIIAELETKNRCLEQQTGLINYLLEASNIPIWTRDTMGRLTWINQAYMQAVDVDSVDYVIENNLELLDSDALSDIVKSHQDKTIVSARTNATLTDQRRVLDVIDVSTPHGTAGIAIDVTEATRAQSELNRILEFQKRVLDELKTPIAVFGQDQRLRFYNTAYQELWQLDHAFLDADPLESEILERLRTRRLLQEQSDFVKWRETFLRHYQALERCDDEWWYLPDGRTLRVIVTPHPQGGVIQIFENVTEELGLRSRVKRLLEIQGETLDHLSEGVAVFTSDGRLQLSNPAFLKIWDLPSESLHNGQHIGQITQNHFADDFEAVAQAWQKISTAITSLQDRRNGESGQIACADKKCIDFAIVPLPDGMSMLTFVDVTDSVQMKHALIERNQALETADAVRSTFIKHVSYALRAPLTNIIGFAQLLSEPVFGQLNEKQNEYVAHILSSSSSLMAIINDVMDLATVEAGIMELDLSEVDIPKTIEAVSDALQDRLKENKIQLIHEVAPNIGSFIGDAKRVRQVLFNVLDNAIRFSKIDGLVTLKCQRKNDEIIFEIIDDGPGIPETRQDTALHPYDQTISQEGHHHVGLGLSIVQKFMELHQGHVTINAVKDKGTHVICRFPAQPQPVPQAAE